MNVRAKKLVCYAQYNNLGRCHWKTQQNSAEQERERERECVRICGHAFVHVLVDENPQIGGTQTIPACQDSPFFLL